MNPGSFVWLFSALVFFLAGVPVAEDIGIMDEALVRSGAFSVLLAIGVWSLFGSHRLFVVGMALALLGIALNIAAVRSATPALLLASYIAFFSFLLFAVAHAFVRVVFATSVSLDRLLGAICVYMLFGIVWATAYAILFLLMPDSFAMKSGGTAMLSEWLYYSFVTMTTLGYGDIVPVAATARALAYSQSIVGQFYIAILVAGLVSAYISSDSKN